MLSTLDTKQHDPHDVLEISPDVVLVARAAADFPSLAPEATGREAHMGLADAATPSVDTTFRASDTSGERHSHGKWLRSAAVAFLFALTSGFGAAAWQRYGDEAQAMLAGFSPQSTLAAWLASSLPHSIMPERATVAAQPDDSAAPKVRAAQPAAPQAADSAPPAAPALPADTAQLLQSMARDVASLNQQLGELKARIAELKAGQEQLGREMARAQEARISEARPAEPRPVKLGAPPRPLGTLVHRAKPPNYPPAQAAYVPPPPPTAGPVQIAPAPPAAAAQSDTDTVLRPPMPVR